MRRNLKWTIAALFAAGIALGSPTIKGTLLVFEATDATATPGAATINKPSGQVAVAAGAATVTITNSYVTTASIVLPVIQESDATCTTVLRAVPGTGSVVITLNATCTADTNVGFVVLNQ